MQIAINESKNSRVKKIFIANLYLFFSEIDLKIKIKTINITPPIGSNTIFITVFLIVHT